MRRPWRDLGAVSCPLTIALRTWTHGKSVSSGGSMTRRPIASEIRRPVDASNSNSERHCGGISAAAARAARASESAARRTRRRARVGGGEARSGADVADHQTGAGGVAQAGAQRKHGVVHRAVAKPMPVGSVLATEPVDEPAHALFVEVAQTLLGCEVRQRVGDQQAPVLAARAIVDDVMRTATGVVIDPLQRVAVQGRPGPARGLVGRGADLDLARLAKRGRRSPALTARPRGRRPPTASRARRRRASRCAPAAPPSTSPPPLSPWLSPCEVRRGAADPAIARQHGRSAAELKRAREDSNL